MAIWQRIAKDDKFVAVVLVLKNTKFEMALASLAGAQGMLESIAILLAGFFVLVHET